MAVSFFPFNSIVANGVADRAANAENLAAYLAGFFSDGVIMQDDTALQVAVDSGMNLQILAGTGNINGKTILNTTAASITIEAASATLKRIDRVIFRLDENNRLMEFDVLKGTAASSPTAPALTRSGGIYEMCLAEVLVPAGATSILASYITDTRSDNSKCGIASIPPHMQDIAHGGTGKTTAAEALAALGGCSIEKVWENASPNSAFAAQTIDLSLNPRDVVRVEFKPSTTGSERFFIDGIVGNDILATFIAGGNSNVVPELRTRNISIQTTAVKFFEAYAKTFTATTAQLERSKSIIPVAIYIINNLKGVS